MKVTPKRFASQLKKGNIPKVVFLYGSEYTLIKKTLERLISVYDVSHGVVDFSGRELSMERFLEEVFSPSLFSEKKLIIVRDALDFYHSLGASSKGAFEKFLLKLPPSTCLVFVESVKGELKSKDKEFISIIDKLGFVVNCRKAETGEIKKWLSKRLSKYGLADSEFIDFLVDISGGSFDILESELDKLFTSLDKSSLTKTKVYTPFKFIELALSSSFEAFEALDYLFSINFDPILLLVLFQSILRKILQVKRFPESASSFDIKKYGRWAERLSEDFIEAVLVKLVELELKLKTSSISPKILFEDLLHFLIYRYQ